MPIMQPDDLWDYWKEDFAAGIEPYAAMQEAGALRFVWRPIRFGLDDTAPPPCGVLTVELADGTPFDAWWDREVAAGRGPAWQRFYDRAALVLVPRMPAFPWIPVHREIPPGDRLYQALHGLNKPFGYWIPPWDACSEAVRVALDVVLPHVPFAERIDPAMVYGVKPWTFPGDRSRLWILPAPVTEDFAGPFVPAQALQTLQAALAERNAEEALPDEGTPPAPGTPERSGLEVLRDPAVYYLDIPYTLVVETAAAGDWGRMADPGAAVPVAYLLGVGHHLDAPVSVFDVARPDPPAAAGAEEGSPDGPPDDLVDR